MNWFEILQIVTTVVAVLVAIQTFHNYTMSRKARFWLSIGMLVALLLTLAVSVEPMAKNLRVILFAMALFIYMQSVTFMLKHSREQRRKQPYFQKYKPLIVCYLAVIFQKKGLLHFSDSDIGRIKGLIRNSPKHAQKTALKFSKEAFTQASNRQLRQIIRSYRQMDVELLAYAVDRKSQTW